MEWLLLLISFFIALAITVFFTPNLVRVFKKRKVALLFGPDVNKYDRPKIPSLGGIAVVIAFMLGVMVNVLISEILGVRVANESLLYGGMFTLLFIAFLGLVDDIYVVPLRLLKPAITLGASIPFIAMALKTGNTIITLPFFGNVNFGLFYVFILIPVFIVFGSNSMNIMAGFNGLTTGCGLIMTIGMLIISLFQQNSLGMLFFGTLLATLVVFFYYNKYPAKVFPGDVGDLFLGAAIAIGAIISSSEKAFVIMMIPYIVHFFLYSRNGFKFKPQAYGVPQKDGTLKCRYDKPYGLMHIVMLKSKKATEKLILKWMFSIVAVFTLLAVIIELLI